MASFTDRIRTLFRARVGKYDANDVAHEIGLLKHGYDQVSVTQRQAMGIAAVYACVYRIASTIASLDLGVYRKQNGGTERLDEHPTQTIISHMPNEYMTSVEFWESVVGNACAHGAGHAVITRDNSGRATAMYPVAPDEVQYVESKTTPMYKVAGFGMIPMEDMLCIYNLHRKSPISLHRENLGLAKAAQSYGAGWFNDGQMTGILTTDQPLRNEQMKALRQSWKQQGGATTRLVPHGMKYQRITIAPSEAQFIEVRKFQAEEIARIFGVPPALIQLESQTTYNNVEQQNIMYGRHTIAPWVGRIEAELDRKLLFKQERPATYTQYDLTSMYRGDMNARKQFYEGLLRLGVMSINEVREKEGMNPVANGDVRTLAVNQISLDKFEAFSQKLTEGGVQ